MRICSNNMAEGNVDLFGEIRIILNGDSARIERSDIAQSRFSS